MRLKITSRELTQTLAETEPTQFPKYATQIINLANRFAQGTRPSVVGQQTELIQEFPGRTLEEWQAWYLTRYPRAIEEATQRIYAMTERLRETIAGIDRSMVEAWVKDLVLVKTFVGLRFQGAILHTIAAQKNVPYRFSTTDEEARGIDGYIGDLPVSIKPDTYKTMAQLPENIGVAFIYYTKQKDGLVLEYDF